MNFFNVMVLIAFLTLAGTKAGAQEGSAEDQPATEATAASIATEVEGASPESDAMQPPDIMDQPLDGTSLEAFTAGLERLDQEASEDQYRKVMSALDYLLFYDIGARRDKAKLYAKLHGETPNQILERVNSTRKKRN